MNSPQETVKLVIEESDRLKHFLEALKPEDWHVPSACDRWEIGDVVTHLILVAQFYAYLITRSLKGDPSAPKGFPAPGTADEASFAEENASRTIAMRKKMGNRLLDEFTNSNDQLNQMMTNLGPEDWDKPHFSVSLGTTTLRDRPCARLVELVIHGWDIRSRFNSDTHLTAETLPDLVWAFGEPLLRWNFRPGPKLSAPVRYRFILTDIEGYNQDFLITGDSAKIVPVGMETASLTYHSDAETYVLLMSGRLLLSDALAQNRLLADGDMELADKFSRWFGL